MKSYEEDSDVLEPTQEEHPDTSSNDRSTSSTGIPLTPSSTPLTLQPEPPSQPSKMLLQPVRLSESLDAIRSEINAWVYVQNLDRISTHIWRIWRNRHSTNAFENFMEREVEEADVFLSRLGALPSESLFPDMEWQEVIDTMSEITALQSKVHLVRSALSVRLDWVYSGLIEEYPKILCPIKCII